MKVQLGESFFSWYANRPLHAVAGVPVLSAHSPLVWRSHGSLLTVPSAVVQHLTDGPGRKMPDSWFSDSPSRSNIPQKCLQYPKSLALLLIPHSVPRSGCTHLQFRATGFYIKSLETTYMAEIFSNRWANLGLGVQLKTEQTLKNTGYIKWEHISSHPLFYIKCSIREMKWSGAGPHHITQIQIAVMKSSVKK